jgi:alcohol dehydrogenase class IV
MVPHGMSVSLTAPEAFRFSFPSAPERHLAAAALLAPDEDKQNDPGEQLPAAEKYPELRGDQRPVLAHEGRYHAKPLRAGDDAGI